MGGMMVKFRPRTPTDVEDNPKAGNGSGKDVPPGDDRSLPTWA